jgi:glycosyltransferase involved in cell wall biosynthesis
MRIGIDAHMLGKNETGNETYIRGLLQGFAQLNPPGTRFFVFVENGEALPEIVKGHPDFEPVLLKKDSAISRLLFDFPKLAGKYRLNMLHVTYNAPLFCPCPLAVTVHDVSFARYPAWFSPRDRILLGNLVPRSVKRARAVFVGAGFTRKELVSLYGLAESKIFVTPYGLENHFRPVQDNSKLQGIRQKFRTGSNYILALGNLQPRKNIQALLKTYCELVGQGLITQNLVIAGKPGWQAEQIYREARANGLEERVILTGYVPDEDLPALYSAADLFVFPSLYEGFGFPVLEAMACGAPVLSSSSSVLPDVGGKAAAYFDPARPDALKHSLAALLKDKSILNRMSEAGLVWSRRFRWKQTAQQTLETYRVATGQPNREKMLLEKSGR